jgi:hypothetical protein
MFIIQMMMDLTTEQFLFHSEYFDQIMGTAAIRQALCEHRDVPEIVNRFNPDLNNFRNIRESHLLY